MFSFAGNSYKIGVIHPSNVLLNDAYTYPFQKEGFDTTVLKWLAQITHQLDHHLGMYLELPCVSVQLASHLTFCTTFNHHFFRLP